MLDGDYFDSIYAGKWAIIHEIDAELARCPDMQFVLGGYSQGALAVRLALDSMTTSELDHVAAVILVADPAKNLNPSHLLWEADQVVAGPGSGVYGAAGIWQALDFLGYRGVLEPRTIEICHNNDIVCAPGFGSWKTQHENYSSSEMQHMGEWAAVVAADHIAPTP